MAQINLLKQKKPGTDIWQALTSIFVKLLAVLVLGLLVYYGFLIFRAKKEIRVAIEVEQKIETKRRELSQKPDRDELFTRQQQLRELQTILDSHPYWSGLLPALAQASLKTSNYMTLKALSDGTLSLNVTVPGIEELDKFLQVFDLPEYNKNFFDIKIGSIGRTQVQDKLQTSFDVRMRYNPNLLRYQE